MAVIALHLYLSNKKTVPVGTLASILRKLEIDRDDFTGALG